MSPAPLLILGVLVSQQQNLPNTAELSADIVLTESRSRLAQLRSMRATLVKQTDFGDRQFQSSGDYLAGAYPRMQMRIVASAGGQSLNYLTICDGQVLWTVNELRAVPQNAAATDDQTVRDIARFDVDRLRTYATEWTLPEQRLELERVLGGLPGLLAGVQQTFNLDTQTEDSVFVLSGPRRDGALASIAKPKSRTASSLPDHVEVRIDRETMIPVQVLYTREKDGKRTPLHLLQLRDVQLNVELPGNAFDYSAPEDSYTDRTRQTIDRIDRMATQESESESAESR